MSLIALTGASGFLGRHFTSALLARGHRVRALVRDLSSAPPTGEPPFRCELPAKIDPAALEGAAILIHAAYTTLSATPEAARQVNENGTRRLYELARRAGVGRIVFISSLSAHPAAVSSYGRSKLALEGELDPERDLAIRPGLVVGDGGLFPRLVRLVRALPVVPLLGGGEGLVQPIHVDDLTEGLIRAIGAEARGRLVLADPAGLTFRALLEAIAQRLGKHRRFVAFPAEPVLRLQQLFEALGIPLPISSDNLLGLLRLARADAGPDLARLGLVLRPLDAALQELS
jgi:nucleoside-diphosphate-sugar epimerase